MKIKLLSQQLRYPLTSFNKTACGYRISTVLCYCVSLQKQRVRLMIAYESVESWRRTSKAFKRMKIIDYFNM